MIDYNALHPYPRYGAAVALHLAGKTPADIETAEALAPLIAEAIERALTRYTVRTLDDPKADGTTMLTFDWVKDPKPGKTDRQTPEFGYYLSPHVTTNDADRMRYTTQVALLKQARAFSVELREGAGLDKQTDLKRSFAPLVAKVNAGKASPSNPRTTRLIAALSALATVTPEKAAAGNPAEGTAALVPDIPLVDLETPGRFPLLDYVALFAQLRSRYYDTAAAMQTPVSKAGGYKWPRLHEGNFPEAPSNAALSTLGVVASVGWWARHGDTRAAQDPEGWARRVLDLLAESPLLIVTYGSDAMKHSRQESFGRHLVGLALDTDLRSVIRALNGIKPVGFVGWNDKASKAKVALFRMMADRFLRLFTRPALRDFLAVRAAYPTELSSVFESYFTSHAMPPLSPDLVASARAYGAALNTAAYRAASANAQSDEKRRGADARSTAEYKQRVLVEFESAVQSAKSGPELLAKVGSRAGRLAAFEMPSEAGPFMEAVATGDAAGGIALGQARDLVTAFMRLSTYDRSASAASSAADKPTPPSAAGKPTPAPTANADLFPDDRA